jgi:hypothetical protein
MVFTGIEQSYEHFGAYHPVGILARNGELGYWIVAARGGMDCTRV